MEKEKPSRSSIWRAVIFGVPAGIALMVFFFGAIEMRRAEKDLIELVPSDAVVLVRVTDAAEWWREFRDTRVFKDLAAGDADMLVEADALRKLVDLSGFRATLEEVGKLKQRKIVDPFSPDLVFDPIAGDAYFAGIYGPGGGFDYLLLARMGYKSYLASKFDRTALKRAGVRLEIENYSGEKIVTLAGHGVSYLRCGNLLALSGSADVIREVVDLSRAGRNAPAHAFGDLSPETGSHFAFRIDYAAIREKKKDKAPGIHNPFRESEDVAESLMLGLPFMAMQKASLDFAHIADITGSIRFEEDRIVVAADINNSNLPPEAIELYAEKPDDPFVFDNLPGRTIIFYSGVTDAGKFFDDAMKEAISADEEAEKDIAEWEEILGKPIKEFYGQFGRRIGFVLTENRMLISEDELKFTLPAPYMTLFMELKDFETAQTDILRLINEYFLNALREDEEERFRSNPDNRGKEFYPETKLTLEPSDRGRIYSLQIARTHKSKMSAFKSLDRSIKPGFAFIEGYFLISTWRNELTMLANRKPPAHAASSLGRFAPTPGMRSSFLYFNGGNFANLKYRSVPTELEARTNSSEARERLRARLNSDLPLFGFAGAVNTEFTYANGGKRVGLRLEFIPGELKKWR